MGSCDRDTVVGCYACRSGPGLTSVFVREVDAEDLAREVFWVVVGSTGRLMSCKTGLERRARCRSTDHSRS